MSAMLRGIPTKLSEADLVGFAPLEVRTLADVRKAQRGKLKTALSLGAAAVAVVALYRGYQEARQHLDDLESPAPLPSAG